MLKNYFKIAIRSLARQRAYSFINITGFAVGIACCLIIFLYVSHEHSYDRFHEQNNRLYRVLRTANTQPLAITSMLLAPTLKDEFPEVENTVRLFPDNGVVNVGEQRFQEDVLLVDASFFEMFTFPLSHGNPTQALSNPDGLVLSQKAAQKFFGEENPMGRELSIRLNETFYNFTVQGIAEPLPQNSSIHFDVLLSMDMLTKGEYRAYMSPSWHTLRPSTYVQLSTSASIEDFEAKLPSFVDTHLPDNMKASTSFQLQPITQVHLDPSVLMGLSPSGNPMYSYILGIIAILILLIASINFTTMTLGLSSNRFREVGIRKVSGARRIQLVKQFWGEAFVVSLIALLMAIILVKLVLPSFNSLVGKVLAFQFNGALLLVLLGLLLIVSLLAGSYPALFLSRLKPVAVLKGGFTGPGRNRLTPTLVVVQFTLSIFLISCVFLMSKQLGMLSQKNLGYDSEQVIRIRSEYGSTWEGSRLLDSYAAALSNEPSVLSLSGSAHELGQLEGASNRFPLTSNTDSVPGYAINVTPDFIKTLGVELLQGRDFAIDRVADKKRAVIVNEALVQEFGWEDPLSQSLSSFKFSDASIIGVVKDFNYESLHKPIEPLAMFVNDPNPVWSIYARVHAGNLLTSVATLEQAWKQVAPDLPFEYVFLDQAVEQQYRSEKRWMTLMRIASLLALFITCLGLLGLVSLTAARRRKEIGIRKVLGASAAQIVLLLSQRFVGLVVLALVLATPIVYVVMARWLETFAYRIDISWRSFVLTGLLAISITLLTVSYQAIQAALANPTKSLKCE